MFNSHININLRERKGWTYGARSGFSGSDYLDLFIVSTSVKANATDSAVVEILKEIEQYLKNGISEEELAFTKKSLGQQDALNYETATQKTNFIKRLIKYNFDKDFTHKRSEILENVTKAELDTVMNKYIDFNGLYIVVVGDKNTILEPLKQLGYPVIEVE